jgi:hypothetical protein
VDDDYTEGSTAMAVSAVGGITAVSVASARVAIAWLPLVAGAYTTASLCLITARQIRRYVDEVVLPADSRYRRDD